jgi:3-deoxy-7-phosphoheptulonate synthase
MVHSWNRGFAENPANVRYEGLAKEIDRAVRFMEAAGADFDELKRVEFYASHEGLLMDYERPLTRIDSRTGLPYVTSGHFLWIGERTRGIDEAHVDFFARVRNPLGVKLGPKTTVADVSALIEKLDPHREPGRLTFITRMGATAIRDSLPPLLEATKDLEVQPVWVTDPMHGNGITTATGYKTRRFDDVVNEVVGFFEAHRSVGTHPGGLHVELTGDDVTECLGGSQKIDELGLETRYESLCDPRLNHQQSLELAFLVAEELSKA